MGHHQVGAYLADDVRQLLHNLVTRGLVQRVGVLVVGGAGHARVPVIEEPHIPYPGNRHRLPQFFLPDLRQRCGSSQTGVANLPHVAVGGAHQGNPRALGRQHRQRPAASEPLVVRVGEHGQDFQGWGSAGHSGTSSGWSGGQKGN